MYFIILGAGEVGVRIAQILSNEGHEIVLIEKNRSRVSHIYNRIDCKLVIAEGIRSETLKEAEIHRADYFIAVTNFDEINLISCLLVKKIAPSVKNISRIRSQEYIDNAKESIFPIDYVVQPEKEAALSIIRSIEIGGGASDVFTFDNFNVMMRNYFVDSDSKFVGQQLKNIVLMLDIPSDLVNKFLIVFINRKEEAIIPSGDFEFQEGDEIYFVGAQSILESLLLHLGKKVQSARDIRKIIILGASAVAEQIVDCYKNTRANSLFSIVGKKKFTSRDIIVIDEDMKLCEEFSDKHSDITVLHADVTEEDILEDLEINQVDMLIATTTLQERNIVLAAHSHNLGVPHTIALVDTPVYFNVAAELGISMSLSVRSAVVSSIIKFLRGRVSLYNLAEGSFSIIECEVAPQSKVVYKSINTITLPPNSLIICISNEKQEGAIAHGTTVIQPQDRLLCIAHLNSIHKLNNLFSLKDTKEYTIGEKTEGKMKKTNEKNHNKDE